MDESRDRDGDRDRDRDRERGRGRDRETDTKTKKQEALYSAKTLELKMINTLPVRSVSPFSVSAGLGGVWGSGASKYLLGK